MEIPSSPHKRKFSKTSGDDKPEDRSRSLRLADTTSGQQTRSFRRIPTPPIVTQTPPIIAPPRSGTTLPPPALTIFLIANNSIGQEISIPLDYVTEGQQIDLVKSFVSNRQGYQIELPFRAEIIEEAIGFIKGQEPVLAPKSALELFRVANYLGIKALKDRVSDYLIQHFDKDLAYRKIKAVLKSPMPSKELASAQRALLNLLESVLTNAINTELSQQDDAQLANFLHANQKYFRFVHMISLSGRTIDPALLRSLRNLEMEKIQTLDISESTLSEDSMTSLMQMDWISQLSGLNLTQTQIDNEMLEILAKTPMPRLRKLFLGDNQISAQGVTALARGAISSLNELYLLRNPIGNVGVSEIATSVRFQHLGILDLFNTEIDDDALKSLATSPYIKLNNLDVGANDISDIGISQISLYSRTSFRALQELGLLDTLVPEKTIEALQSTNFGQQLKIDYE